MQHLSAHKEAFDEDGFVVVEQVYTNSEVQALVDAIEKETILSRDNFRRSGDLFAIRQFLKELPQAVPLVLTDKLQALIHSLFGDDYVVVKSIYFDKPPASNWFVAYHQDLTISVAAKAPVDGFGPWTVKQNQFGVQPPLHILQNNVTVRIHLDNTDENNGALRVLPSSHQKGICRPDGMAASLEPEVSVNVPKGGVMLMRPLLLHASGRTTNNERRRVIHIEFSNATLPSPLQWAEQL